MPSTLKPRCFQQAKGPLELEREDAVLTYHATRSWCAPRTLSGGAFRSQDELWGSPGKIWGQLWTPGPSCLGAHKQCEVVVTLLDGPGDPLGRRSRSAGPPNFCLLESEAPNPTRRLGAHTYHHMMVARALAWPKKFQRMFELTCSVRIRALKQDVEMF